MGRQNADKIAANMTFKKLCRKRRELLAHFAHHDKKAPPEGAAAALLVLRAVVYANLSEHCGRLAEKNCFPSGASVRSPSAADRSGEPLRREARTMVG